MKYSMKYRIGEENDEIIKNKFHVDEAPKVVIDTILRNSFTLKHNTPLVELLSDDKLLKETLYYYLKRIELYISVGSGNFIITSLDELYYKHLFIQSEIGNFQLYIVPERLLPRNVIILGHRNANSFGSPIVAAPLIDKPHFDSICEMNNIRLSDFGYDMKKQWAITERYFNIYSLYQSYLDNVQVPYWYIEKFNNPTKNRQKAYYTTLYFD